MNHTISTWSPLHEVFVIVPKEHDLPAAEFGGYDGRHGFRNDIAHHCLTIRQMSQHFLDVALEEVTTYARRQDMPFVVVRNRAEAIKQAAYGAHISPSGIITVGGKPLPDSVLIEEPAWDK